MKIAITKLFNIILDTGIIPKDWCISLIHPIYKNKGDSGDPDNYRGISLISCVGKLFTMAINERLTNYLNKVGLIGDEQAGFRKNFSTLDHIYVISSLIDLYKHKGKRIYCAFIDYKKAFDLVDRSNLWLKLLGSGINGNFLNIIHNMYLNAKSCVKLNSKVSPLFNCGIGVRQGDNLSPLLFALYINDFELFFKS